MHFDCGEIYTTYKAFGRDDPRLADYVVMASDMILKGSINERKNIVIEIIGDDADLITAMIAGMRGIGYEISVHGIECDIAEAYKRHVRAVEEGQDYISAFHTQEPTLSFFFDYLKGGQSSSIWAILKRGEAERQIPKSLTLIFNARPTRSTVSSLSAYQGERQDAAGRLSGSD